MLPKPAQSDRKFKPGEIKGVVIRPLRKFTDERGWLAELFRHDELEAEFYPVMSYVSSTEPGHARGPHEHREQADLFCFLGPSAFKLWLWDNREDSETYNQMMTLLISEDNPQSVLIPAGVVHAYLNVGKTQGIVTNCPNRLYMGAHRRQEVDEIRHEDDPGTVFRIDD
jgi:dTDP-4-dehydrorhamnose 3,5-epimerase